MKRKRLAIIGPFTWEPLVPHLQAALSQYGLKYEVVGYGFGRDVQLYSGSDVEFEARPPQGAIVATDARTLFEQYLLDPRCDHPPRETAVAIADLVISSIGRVSERHPEISWVIMTAEPPFPNSGDMVSDSAEDPFLVAIDAFNRRIEAECRERPGWSLFNRRSLTCIYGAVTLYDPRMDVLARVPASAAGLPLLAERLAAHWAASQGKMKKVLVLDCDNTLWGGIVGEDGMNGIHIGGDGVGRAYAAFQQAVLAIESRGTLLALCSRNNPADVEEVFAKRSEMVIPRRRIAAVHIEWGPKSEGLQSLSNTLGLGLDSFVFVDDNPMEREQVRRVLPEVVVPEVPADPADLPAFGYELGWRYFYHSSTIAEDRQKTEQYAARAQVEEQRARLENPEEFLESLRMTARMASDSATLVARNTQLTQKTNQFNLTLRRYTENDVMRMTADPNVLVLSGSLSDRFCNHGWVALAVLRRHDSPTRWMFDTFLISCRVLGRGFEQCFAAACIQHARSISDVVVHAEYIPGPKNAQSANFFDSLGFRLVSEMPDGRRVYELRTGEPVRCHELIIEITWKEETDV